MRVSTGAVPAGVEWTCKTCGSVYETPARIVAPEACSFCLGVNTRTPEKICAMAEGFGCNGTWHYRLDDNGRQVFTGRCGDALERTVMERADGVERQLQARLGKVMTFANFDMACEPEAYGSVTRWARRQFPALKKFSSGENPGEKEDRILLLRGAGRGPNAGCGKSHLLTAARLTLARRDIYTAWVARTELGRCVNGMYSSHTEASGPSLNLFESWVKADAVIIDDLGQETSDPEKVAKILCEFLDDRGQKPFAAASNLTKVQIAQRYGAPAASRLLKASVVVEMVGEDYRGLPGT